MITRILTAALCMAALLSFPCAAAEAEARDITKEAQVVSQTGFPDRYALTDGSNYYYNSYPDHSSLTFSYEGGIAGIYLQFDPAYGIYTVTDETGGQTCEFGQNGFLHDYADLEAAFGYAPTRITLHFDAGEVRLSELTLFSPGTLPGWVQRWELPADGQADILLMPTHCDDDQLFLGGIVPLYTAKGYTVQVVYFTGHRNMTMPRCSEALDGLWATGCRVYPVFGDAPDIYSENFYDAKAGYNSAGWSWETLESFVIENIRRFRPSVVVTHDLKGEYGHGAHMLYAELIREAVERSMDPAADPGSAEQYGIWDVPKTYLHLYPENQITLDMDEPLEMFGGLSAFQVTAQYGFPVHKSQYDLYSWYFYGKSSAKEITIYSLCEYGLLRSTVGADTGLNDFMENIGVREDEK